MSRHRVSPKGAIMLSNEFEKNVSLTERLDDKKKKKREKQPKMKRQRPKYEGFLSANMMSMNLSTLLIISAEGN